MNRGLRIALLLALPALFLSGCSENAPPDAVHIIHVDGDVDPILERFIDRGLDRAEKNNAKLAIIQIDTPGGLSSSMREIVQRIEASDVPVAVYVYPPGGRAASAGTFITMAGHLAVMAPNTSIGAASAINSDGSDIEGALGRKVENDAVAFIRGIAELRGRNADWAEQAVRDAIAANQTEAVRLDVVDYIANDIDDLLRQAEGRELTLKPGTTARLTGLLEARRVDTEMTGWERFLQIIANPTLASLLITLGFLALVFELANPGLIFPGVVGVIALVLGFLGFGVLPVETAGLVLIAAGFILLAMELFIPSGGILGVGGTAALILGSIIAFRDTPSELQPNKIFIAILAFVMISLFVSISIGVAQLRRKTSEFGTSALVGKFAIARTPLTPEGYVFIQGERWQAEMESGAAQEGDRVRIVGAQGLRLRVRREEPS